MPVKQEVKLRWSKKENDWLVKYPNRNGKITGGVFCGMISDFEKLMSRSWDGTPTGFTNFRDYLIGGGFDPDTFTISVKVLKPIEP